MGKTTVLVLMIALAAPAAFALPVGGWAATTFPEYAWCDVELRDIAFATPTTGVAVGTCMSVYRTTTAGTSWVRDGTTGDLGHLAAADFVSATHGMAVGQNAIFQPSVLYTTDGGATFDWETFYFTQSEPIDAVQYEGSLTDVRMLSESVAVATGRVWNGEGAFVRTTTGGASWSTIDWLPFALYGLDFTDDGALGVAVGDMATIYRSVNEGRTWQPVESPAHGALLDVAIVSASEIYVVGVAGQAFKSTDGGLTWLPVAVPTGVDLAEVDAVAPGDLRVAGAAGSILRSTDGGLTWLPEVTSTTNDIEALHFSTPATGFAGGHETILQYVGVEELLPSPPQPMLE